MENPGKQTHIFLTVYEDVVKTEVCESFKREAVGWFFDEVSAIGAACEYLLIRSAILAELRQLPELAIHIERIPKITHHNAAKFFRATRVKWGRGGRRVVLLPGSTAKGWLPKLAA